MREVAVDYGRRRSGFAINLSDVVLPLEPLTESTWNGIARRLEEIRSEHGEILVILGHPLTPSGKPTELSDEVAQLAAHLIGMGFMVELVPESGTSIETEDFSAASNHRDGRKDSFAAMIILKRYLGLP